MLIDFHCHIDFYKRPEKILNEIDLLKIKTVFVTTSPNNYIIAKRHIKNYKYIELCLGAHPHFAEENINSIDILRKHIHEVRVIGEIGLDFSSKFVKTKKTQIKLFREILNSNEIESKILNLHSLKSEDYVFEMLKERDIKKAVFHWYTGNIKTLSKIIEAGYYISINPKQIRTKKFNDYLKELKYNQILTETDGPFYTLNKNIVHPKDVRLVIDYLTLHNKSNFQNIEKMIFNNAKTLFL